MTILHAARTLFILAIKIFLVTLLSVMAFALLQPFFEPKQFKNADVIVVLGAGMDADGTLHRATRLRVKKGVKLFQAGAAPKIHFTGGVGTKNGLTAGGQMARLAQRLGVPEAAITFEGKSFSTLQNALFSMPYLQDAKRLILVTEGFHLPRSWASFKYFGAPDIALARSTAFRTGGGFGWLYMTARESLAIWFNLGRLIIWQSMAVLPYDQETRDAILY